MANGFNLNVLGNRVTRLIKEASWFPYKRGKLKFEATSGRMWDETTYRINFSSSVAPYVEYLEEGTDPHIIRPKNPNGVLAFKVKGNMVFTKIVHHPGSTKHKDFIKDKCVRTIVDYIATRYGGMVEVL